jgi:hypothetical protein
MTGSVTAHDSQAVGPGWEAIVQRRPQLAAAACRFLDQIAVSLRPNTVIKIDQVLIGSASTYWTTIPKWPASRTSNEPISSRSKSP